MMPPLMSIEPGEGKHPAQQVRFPANLKDDDRAGSGVSSGRNQCQQRSESCINHPADGTPFVIQPCSTKGRAVFATRRLPANTPLLETGPPSAYTLNKAYRREVCARCFAYDRGVRWRIRLEQPAVDCPQSPASCSKVSGLGYDLGLVFCSEACRDVWVLRQGQLGLLAWTAVWEIGSRRQGRKRTGASDGETGGGGGSEDKCARPTAEEIDMAWADVEDGGARQLREIRMREPGEQMGLTKAEKKLMLRLQNIQPAPSTETLWLVVSAVLTHYAVYFSPDRKYEDRDANDNDWTRIEALAVDATPYSSMEELQDCVNAYQTLLALLPTALLPSLTPKILQAVQNAASHNSFSIRPSLASGAYNAEFLGWGLWTSASIWNHSCAPNVSKKRVGEGWVFVVDADVNGGMGVESGDELCISYLSGEEKELGWEDRKVKLSESWGFDCRCLLCIETNDVK